MPKKTDLPLDKVLVRLYAGEKEVLRQFYPEIGYNAAIRELVHRHVAALRERLSRQGHSDANLPELSSADLELLSGDALQP